MKLSLKPLLFLCLLSLLATSMGRHSLAATPLPPKQSKVITTSAKYRHKPNTMPSTATKPVNDKDILASVKKDETAKSATVGLPVVSTDLDYSFSTQPNPCNGSVSIFTLKKGALLASGSSTGIARWYQQSGAYFLMPSNKKDTVVYYLEPVGPELTQPQSLNCRKPTTKPADYELEPGRKKRS